MLLLCTCTREQHALVGCDDPTPGCTPRNYEREEQEAWDASQATAWAIHEARERREAEAEAAYWERVWLEEAAWTYQAGW